jgi:hypothetical protein
MSGVYIPRENQVSCVDVGMFVAIFYVMKLHCEQVLTFSLKRLVKNGNELSSQMCCCLVLVYFKLALNHIFFGVNWLNDY